MSRVRNGERWWKSRRRGHEPIKVSKARQELYIVQRSQTTLDKTVRGIQEWGHNKERGSATSSGTVPQRLHVMSEGQLIL